MAIECLCMELFNSHTALLLGCRKPTFLSSLFAVNIDTEIQITSATLSDCPICSAACVLGKCGRGRRVSLESSRMVRHESLRNASLGAPVVHAAQDSICDNSKTRCCLGRSCQPGHFCHPCSFHSPSTANCYINSIRRNFPDHFLLHMLTDLVPAHLSNPFLNLLKQKAGTVPASSRTGFLRKSPRQGKTPHSGLKLSTKVILREKV